MKHSALQNNRWVPIALMVAGLALLALGFWRGEADTILKKAVRICLECIGIG